MTPNRVALLVTVVLIGVDGSLWTQTPTGNLLGSTASNYNGNGSRRL
jgi:hypothetical protein